MREFTGLEIQQELELPPEEKVLVVNLDRLTDRYLRAAQFTCGLTVTGVAVDCATPYLEMTEEALRLSAPIVGLSASQPDEDITVTYAQHRVRFPAWARLRLKELACVTGFNQANILRSILTFELPSLLGGMSLDEAEAEQLRSQEEAIVAYFEWADRIQAGGDPNESPPI